VSFSEVRKTVKRTGRVCGVGVHSGQSVQVTLSPSSQKTGIVFRRTDQGGASVPADWRYVTSTRYSTTIGIGAITVSTVEHLMAAFWALGITDAYVDTDGPEVPILDGSSLPWMNCLMDLGLQGLEGFCDRLAPLQAVRVVDGQSWMEIHPSKALRVDMFVPLDNGALQAFSYIDGQTSFSDDVSCARTFSFKKHVQAMLDRGFIRGGSLDNALVIHDGHSINELGFRQPDECARHKVLDFLGDWALCGKVFKGHVIGFASGHGLNHALLRQVIQQTESVKQHQTRVTFSHAPQSLAYPVLA
jgi:UDP-3-O-[3-hydroxymyristoyl] N-acetylglucosamine deacetylase